MPDDTTIVFGVPVPSIDPGFLAVVRFHILVGVVCVLAGLAAMTATAVLAVVRFSNRRHTIHWAGGRPYGTKKLPRY